MIPEGEDLARRNNRLNGWTSPPAPPMPPAPPAVDDDGLIVPRKLANPVAASRGHRDLHRELMFNNKIGKNVLGQKSELQRALEKHKEHQERSRADKEREESQLEQIIHERARRLEEKEKGAVPIESVTNGDTEFQAVHAKLRSRNMPK